MNVSYKWLKEYVDFDMTAEEVGKALTSMGLEVEAVEEVQSIKGRRSGADCLRRAQRGCWSEGDCGSVGLQALRR